MFISYNWLRELTDTTLTPQELRERLTMVGLAIDAVEESNSDFVLDVEVPSNRPDCLSHVGIAREVAVIERGKVQQPSGTAATVEGKSSDLTSVEIKDPDLCPRYAARLVRWVKIAPSPPWLAKRLEEIGQRPINNVADITNYVLHEMGQPLHAFDFAKLAERRIIVRRASAGETFKTLDGVERKLDQTMLVIADAEKPVALAGIMGGEDSEISHSTTDVLIESAYFHPDSVRRTARRLGMDTEASRRFERGADCDNVMRAQTRCVELICELAGGVATEDAIDVYPNAFAPRSVAFRPDRVESLTSLRVAHSEMNRILSALGFVAEAGEQGRKSYVVPSWRGDVSLEEDLVEEIARHSGYDNIASELPPATMSGEYQPTEMNRRDLRRALRDYGFDEAINFSFIESDQDEMFELIPAMVSRTEPAFVTLGNPIIENVVRMRPTLIPGLLQAVRHNLNHGVRDVRLFEIGRIFANSASGELPVEREALSLIATGGLVEENRAQAEREMDFYDLKGAVEAAVSATNRSSVSFAASSIRHLREGQSAKIFLDDGTEIGSLGRLAEDINEIYKFRQPIYVAELDLTSLLSRAEKPVQYSPLARYPSVMRDVTLLVDRQVTLQALLRAIESEHTADYRGAQLVGTYEGANIPDNKRAVTLRIEYRSDERTLRDDEVEDRHRSLIDMLLKKFAALLH